MYIATMYPIFIVPLMTSPPTVGEKNFYSTFMIEELKAKS